MAAAAPALVALLMVFLAGLLCSCLPRPGAEVVIGMEDDLMGLDPHRHDETITFCVLSNIYDCLVRFDGQMHVVPDLAVSWENPVDTIWRFHLRPGVTFHDGSPCGAEDVKFSLERAKRMELAHYLATVSEVTVVDPLTVEVRTGQPSPILLNKLTFIAIMPKGQPDTVSAPVGTGPYRFVSYQKGQQAVLEAYAHHWGREPAIRRAVLRFMADHGQRVEALLDGSIHLAREMRTSELDRVRSDPGFAIATSPSMTVNFLGINLRDRGPFRRTKVRQAVYTAIDTREWIERLKMDAQPADQFVSPFIVGYLPDLKADRPDTERARRLLGEAGYPLGFDVDLEVTSNAATRSAPVVAEQLGRIGIRVSVKVFDWKEQWARIQSGRSPFFLIGWSCSSGDASDFLDACLHTRDSRFGEANWGGYSNAKLDALIERIDATLDNRQRIALMHQALALAMRDYPMVPGYIRNHTSAYTKRLSFVPRLDDRLRLDELSWR